METSVISVWEGVRSPAVFVYVCVRKSDQYVLGENGRACGVKLCSPAPVTVSDPVTIAAFELLRLGTVKGQFVIFFKLQCRPHAREGTTDGE